MSENMDTKCPTTKDKPDCGGRKRFHSIDNLDAVCYKPASKTDWPFMKRIMARREIPTCCLMPDPSAERDLDNSSPETRAMCDQFPCHYCVFVYLRSNEVDDELFPFFRQECQKILELSELCDEHKQRLGATSEMKDVGRDRRLKAIEVQTQCQLRMGQLDPLHSLKKGLPRRRLTFAGPSFTHICHAVQMMETKFPRLMQFALYPYRLPASCDARRYQSARTVARHYRDHVSRQPGCLSLLADINARGNWRKFVLPYSRCKEI